MTTLQIILSNPGLLLDSLITASAFAILAVICCIAAVVVGRWKE